MLNKITTVQRLLFTLLILNLATLLLVEAIPATGNLLFEVPVDDWQYKVEKPTTEQPMALLKEYLQAGPLYIVAIIILLEIAKLFLACELTTVTTITIFGTFFFLYSISGPMIGSITDQTARDFGFSAGGAKDINNFRANIAAGYLPGPSDITYEGLFYDYRFDTGKNAAMSSDKPPKLFAPTWSAASSRNPLTGEIDHYLAVGLSSQLDRAAVARKKLNLVVVLDISGSMSSPFNQYYYESHRRRPDMRDGSANMTKLESACRSIVAMFGHLRPDDRIGIALFNHRSHLAKPVSSVRSTDMEALKRHVLALEPTGATSMEEGLELGRSMLAPFSLCNPDEYENRIIFMTDAMPNTDDTSESGLLDMTREMARNRVYLTFIGMGIDFNSQMVKSISQVRGANYFSVHSPAEFRKRLADEFECMVNPMVFDLALQVQAPECKILKVIGSPEADLANGRIMNVSTLFPAPTDADGTRGGIILLQLDRPMVDTWLTLTLSYEDRRGTIFDAQEKIILKAHADEHFDDNGIRKGILLARYADLLKDTATGRHGIRVATAAAADSDGSGWSYWERPGRRLQVSAAANDALSVFRQHFSHEAEKIGDPTLLKELRLLDDLIALIPADRIEN